MTITDEVVKAPAHNSESGEKVMILIVCWPFRWHIICIMSFRR